MKLEETIKTEYANIDKSTIQISKTEDLECLSLFFSLYKKIMHHIVRSETPPESSIHLIKNWMKKEIKNKNFTYAKEDVEKFSFALAEIQQDFPKNTLSTRFSIYTGLFLSALINIHHEQTKMPEEYTIHTSQFDSQLEYLCYQNTANVRVIGSVGDSFCAEMICGNVHLEGNARDRACEYMIDGTVQIDGDVADYLCLKMEEGKITVNGSTGSFPAQDMNRGNVHIYGNTIGTCREMKGGTVIVEGNDTDNCAWRMSGGTLLIKGNVGERIGVFAQKCYIHVARNAGKDAGLGMISGILRIDGKVGINAGNYLDGGNIYINGDCESIAASAKKGRIYVKGKQVFPYMETDWISQMYHCMFKW